VKLNDIRNKVMHPVRSEDPSEEEYKFVRGLRQLLAPANWE
jgi:hypothetical protein